MSMKRTLPPQALKRNNENRNANLQPVYASTGTSARRAATRLDRQAQQLGSVSTEDARLVCRRQASRLENKSCRVFLAHRVVRTQHDSRRADLLHQILQHVQIVDAAVVPEVLAHVAAGGFFHVEPRKSLLAIIAVHAACVKRQIPAAVRNA